MSINNGETRRCPTHNVNELGSGLIPTGMMRFAFKPGLVSQKFMLASMVHPSHTNWIVEGAFVPNDRLSRRIEREGIEGYIMDTFEAGSFMNIKGVMLIASYGSLNNNSIDIECIGGRGQEHGSPYIKIERPSEENYLSGSKLSFGITGNSFGFLFHIPTVSLDSLGFEYQDERGLLQLPCPDAGVNLNYIARLGEMFNPFYAFSGNVGVISEKE